MCVCTCTLTCVHVSTCPPYVRMHAPLMYVCMPARNACVHSTHSQQLPTNTRCTCSPKKGPPYARMHICTCMRACVHACICTCSPNLMPTICACAQSLMHPHSHVCIYARELEHSTQTLTVSRAGAKWERPHLCVCVCVCVWCLVCVCACACVCVCVCARALACMHACHAACVHAASTHSCVCVRAACVHYYSYD